MNYTSFLPGAPLREFIEKYYLIQSGFLPQPGERRMFADGCMDMIINIGEGTPRLNGTPLVRGKPYISGFMSSFVTLSHDSGFSFFGVQFKPGGISHFVDDPVIEYAEKTVEFDNSHFCSIIDDDARLVARVDRFFISRLRERQPVSSIIDSILAHQGRISVDDLKKRFLVSSRTLERLFKSRVGLSPKEFLSLTRFRNALGIILGKGFGKVDESLLSIACNAGYYDHAHLTREVKHFTGLTPTEIIRLEEQKRMFVAEFLNYPGHDRGKENE
jgi:AraC-like DNA-binding protein